MLVSLALAVVKSMHYKIFKILLLPRFLQSYYSREQIFAHGYHHMLTKDYSENHNILTKNHIIDLELQTIF